MNTRQITILVTLLFVCSTFVSNADPLLTSWFTTYSGKYARVYTNAAAAGGGNAATIWSNGTQTQSLPAYCGVQELYSSSNWVYLRTTGLGSHTMGPWSTGFPNLPANIKVLYTIPRSPTVPTTKTLTGLGAIGFFVDGVSMFDSRDAFYWNGTAEVSGNGYWNRDAYVNESATFDPAYAHQENTGTYHYHANPIALRYLLGDHVDYNPSTKTFSESTNAVTKHSPLLGWVRDGFPVYGPYGYSSASNAASGVRRMISGYVVRNGQNGTQNVTSTGRTNIPQWAVRVYGVSASQSGPNVSTTYPLGRYLEDNDFLGDLGKTQGVDFDLDQYNGRYCATPEYPNGTYAYFVSISSTGVPLFPYNIGRAFYGNPSGSSMTSISETVATNFLVGPNSAAVINPPLKGDGTVTLTWSATEGGAYTVLSSTNLTSWVTNATGVAAVTNGGRYSGSSTDPNKFFRVARTSLASYDPVSGSGTSTGGATITISPASGTHGNTVSIMATISSSATPNVPPTMATISSFTIGTLTVSNPVHSSQYVVSGSLTIPSNATLGAQTATITFSPPQGQTQGPSYTQTAAFTIN